MRVNVSLHFDKVFEDGQTRAVLNYAPDASEYGFELSHGMQRLSIPFYTQMEYETFLSDIQRFLDGARNKFKNHGIYNRFREEVQKAEDEILSAHALGSGFTSLAKPADKLAEVADKLNSILQRKPGS